MTTHLVGIEMIEQVTLQQKRRPGRPATGQLPMLSFKAPRPAINAIQAEAARRGCAYSVIAREAIEAYVRNLGQEREAEAA
jgi:hypothetical protein